VVLGTLTKEAIEQGGWVRIHRHPLRKRNLASGSGGLFYPAGFTYWMPSDSTSVGAKLDHVMIMVHDLGSAAADYRKLGFRVRSGRQFPGGIETAIIPFGTNMPYLELVGIYQPGGEQIRDNEEFLARGEGAIYVGLEVASAPAVAARLRELGVEVPGPTSGTTSGDAVAEAPPPPWTNVMIPHGTSPRADPLFFVEYNQSIRANFWARDPDLAGKNEGSRKIPHPNGAVTLAVAWLAIDDIDTTSARFEGMGFRRVREFQVDELGAHGIELALDAGSLLLMESTSDDGPVSKVLRLRGFGIEVPGIGIEVPSIDQALAGMSPEISARLHASETPRGRRVVVPPELAHGLWLELFERAMPVG
jgi:catechol 2,3-dioxygenase-like lactoylglutathione lyase family enzyme